MKATSTILIEMILSEFKTCGWEVFAFLLSCEPLFTYTLTMVNNATANTVFVCCVFAF